MNKLCPTKIFNFDVQIIYSYLYHNRDNEMKYMSSHFNCCFLSLCDKRPRKENKTCNT